MPGELGQDICLINGHLWIVAAGAPSASQGKPGYLYLNSSNGDYYQKEFDDVTWTLKGNLTGPQGPQGIQGPQGPQGIQGPAGPSAFAGFLSRGYPTEDALANDTTNPASGVYINGNINIPTAGDYEVYCSWVWSGNDGSQDVLVDIEIDGTVYTIQVSEPQDTGGSGPQGTNQRYPFSIGIPVNFGTTGNKNFQIKVYGSANDTADNPTLYRAYVRAGAF